MQVDGHGAVGPDGKQQPVELVFLKAYGRIECHLWFGLGYLLIGFASGRVLVLSTDPDAIGRELYSSQLFSAPVSRMSFCPFAARARASAWSARL